jgi:hypothetical protein
VNLEERSFWNLVWYYRKRLWRIVRGEPAEVFSYPERRNLRRRGVLEEVSVAPGGKKLRVTEKALKVLEALP